MCSWTPILWAPPQGHPRAPGRGPWRLLSPLLGARLHGDRGTEDLRPREGHKERGAQGPSDHSSPAPVPDGSEADSASHHAPSPAPAVGNAHGHCQATRPPSWTKDLGPLAPPDRHAPSPPRTQSLPDLKTLRTLGPRGERPPVRGVWLQGGVPESQRIVGQKMGKMPWAGSEGLPLLTRSSTC